MKFHEQLGQSQFKGIFSLTGGGSLFLSELSAYGGASQSLISARMPYDYPATDSYLGYQPLKYCTLSIAEQMACIGFREGISQGYEVNSLFSVGLTASLTTTSPKRSKKKAFLAIQTMSKLWFGAYPFQDIALSRIEEERLISNWIQENILIILGIKDTFVLEQSMRLSFVNGCVDWLKPRSMSLLKGVLCERARYNYVLSGSFNPMHQGHLKMARLVSDPLKDSVVFELSMSNVDKPLLTFKSIQTRRDQLMFLRSNESAVLTDLPYFHQKAKNFPNSIFLIGIDTCFRIQKNKYYQDDLLSLERSLEIIDHYHCRFMVFPRKINHTVCQFKDFQWNKKLQRLCDEVAIEHFFDETSSSHIRKVNGQNEE